MAYPLRHTNELRRHVAHQTSKSESVCSDRLRWIQYHFQLKTVVRSAATMKSINSWYIQHSLTKCWYNNDSRLESRFPTICSTNSVNQHSNNWAIGFLWHFHYCIHQCLRMAKHFRILAPLTHRKRQWKFVMKSGGSIVLPNCSPGKVQNIHICPIWPVACRIRRLRITLIISQT